jgi:hypothetical protein
MSIFIYIYIYIYINSYNRDISSPAHMYAIIYRPDYYYATLLKNLPPVPVPPVSDPVSVSMKTHTLHELIDLKRKGFQLVLCPQHLPKFHSDFDTTIKGIDDDDVYYTLW